MRKRSLVTLRGILLAVLCGVEMIVQGPAEAREPEVWVSVGQENLIQVVDMEAKTVASEISLTMGKGPWKMAFTAHRRYAFVACLESSQVVLFDVEARAERKAIDLGFVPSAIRVSPDDRYLYVADGQGDTVSIFEIETFRLIHRVVVGVRPVALAFSPDGAFAYVLNQGDHTVSIIRTSDYAVAEFVEVGLWPSAIVLSPDGQQAYVLSGGNGTIEVIRLSDRQIAERIDVGKDPEGLAIIPDGKSILIWLRNSRNLRVFDTAQNKVVSEITVSAFPQDVVVSSRGSFAYALVLTPNGKKSLDVISMEEGGVIETVPLGEGTLGTYSLGIEPEEREAQRLLEPLATVVPGDCDSDSEINALDLVCIMNAILGRGTPSGNADCNSDGKVDVLDIICVIKELLHLNSPVVVGFATPGLGPPPLEVHFSCLATDLDGNIELYQWDFDGDGTWDYESSTSCGTVHTYPSKGTYTATVRVTDNDDLSATSKVTIVVGAPPVASASADVLSGATPLAVTFTGTGMDTDGTIVLYEWDFDGDGTFDWSSPVAGNASYTYETAGIFDATLRVTDNDGLKGTASLVILVSGRPKAKPRAYPMNGVSPLVVTLFSDGEDLDGSIVKFEWDYEGDGTFEWSKGYSTNVKVTYVGPGVYHPTLRVTDNEGVTDTASITITVGIPDEGKPSVQVAANPTNGGAPLRVIFTAVARDPFGSITQYEWDFDGDGIDDQTETPLPSGFLSDVSVDYASAPALVDIDDDGDFDLFVGDRSGGIRFFRNDGSKTNPVWTDMGWVLDKDGNPIQIGLYATPAFVDIDGDGDVDLFVGEGYGRLFLFQNDGTKGAPLWTPMGAVNDKNGNPIDVGYYSAPTLVDIDGDGDQDLYLGEGNGKLYFYRNDGTSSSPLWTLVGWLKDIENDTIGVGYLSAPAFVDIDGDGDQDLFIGSEDQKLYFYRNDGTSASPIWSLVTTTYRDFNEPLYWLKPAFADLDGDGDLDLVIGEYFGSIYLDITAGVTTSIYDTPGTYEARVRVTDNDGNKATDSVTITVYPAGFPTASASASPRAGAVPLHVTFSGKGTAPHGSIVLYEWDFDGNGVYDWSSATTGETSHGYDTVGLFQARLRVTDNEGQSATDAVLLEVIPKVEASVTGAFRPIMGEQGTLTLNLTGEALITIVIVDSNGNTVRTLVAEAAKSTGSYDFVWDGKNDAGEVLPDGVYYFVIEYKANGKTYNYDPRRTSTFEQVEPSRSFPGSFAPFKDQFYTVTYSLSQAVEVSLYIWTWGADGWTVEHVRTLFNREVRGPGLHTEIWDGTDDKGAPAPSGKVYAVTIWAWEIPENGIVIYGDRPEISEVSAEPNYFNPNYNPYAAAPVGQTVVSFNLSKGSHVEVRIENNQGVLIRAMRRTDLPAGPNSIIWDGRDHSGNLVKYGGYRISLTAIDHQGNRSMPRSALVMVYY